MSQEDSLLNNNLKGINNNINHLNNNLNSFNSQLGNINSEIGNINNQQQALDGRMNAMSGIIDDFIKTDKEKRELQVAENMQESLKQDLSNKFGYYEEIRRTVLGILQAVDSGIVRHEIMQDAAESLMIKTPNYWLAPAMVAIVAWVRDDREDTERALNEALRRDDYKTTLFFMLLMRRLGRDEACHQWVQRYLMHQDPYRLDREFVMVLEAAATGSFPTPSRELIISTVDGWLNLLTQTDQYINEQKNEWLKFFQSKGRLDNKEYPFLEKYCTNWADLKSSMKKAKLHQFLISYFKNILNTPIDYSKTSKNQLDEILSLLITNFDDEEFELQKKIKLNQQLIDKKKDRRSVKLDYALEKAFEDKTNFLQMLTNVAFIPELAGGTHATQPLAVAISSPWIVEAHEAYTADYRMNAVTTANLAIENYKISSDSTDETEQMKAHGEHWDKILKDEVKKASSGNGCIVAITIPIYAFGLFCYLTDPKAEFLGYLIFSVCTGFLALMYWAGSSKKAEVRKKVNESRIKSDEALRGCLTELKSFKAEYDMEDAKTSEVKAMLQSIQAEEFLANSRITS
ncbi:hypothetical protein [Chryseobacterium aurantiacum]|uniref:hypothetical protein n=1 Tax=Chryseobacterium aurantiacum TaxID=2116499 RepID=UPI000D131EAB|nr:hypothetical protein [Chryseobacterium aurantiacum]